MQVRGRLDDRKYRGSYELIADLMRTKLNLRQPELEKLFQQVAFSILVRNGDAHMKNFGVLYTNENDIRLSPMFDVLTTSIYPYTRFGTGVEVEDNTMALKLRRSDKRKTYPLPQELIDFGRDACGVARPHEFIEKAAESMLATLSEARQDDRIPGVLVDRIEKAWEHGFSLAKEITSKAKSS
jgi:serine/threonine-protein kinase HipA